ncbi:MAG: terminase small subunit [Rhodospirillales bacterium]|jgi:phage terminase small subunit|nr:terminase small subunit [Rhodospirillales bacterium]
MNGLGMRQEAFCRRFVECANATLAAKIAGYAPGSARNAGYRLLRRPRVIARIAALHRELAQQQCRDVDIMLGKLETIYRRAIDTQQCSAAARAVELQAKLSAGALTPPAASGAGRQTSATRPGNAPLPAAAGIARAAANDDGA